MRTTKIEQHNDQHARGTHQIKLAERANKRAQRECERHESEAEMGSAQITIQVKLQNGFTNKYAHLKKIK